MGYSPTPGTLVEVVRACGHREQVRVTGPHLSRPARMAALAGQSCSTCFGWPVISSPASGAAPEEPAPPVTAASFWD